MNDQQEFIQVLASIMGVQNQNELEQGIKSLGEEGLKIMYKQYQQVKDKGSQGLQILKQTYEEIMGQNQTYAKLGAKLNYINRLRGKCPEGYEVERYGLGGCVKCKKKQLEKQQIIERFKSEKCGGTMKKRVPKKEAGDKVTYDHGTNFNGYEVKVKYKGRDLNPSRIRTDNKSDKQKWEDAKRRFKNFK